MDEIDEQLKAVNFERCGRLPSAKRMTEIVAAAPFPLPQEYLEFLERCGGGILNAIVSCRPLPKPPVEDEGDDGYLFDEFFVAAGEDDDSLLTAWRWHRDIVDRGIPFAASAGGNLFCFGRDGQVLFWDHEEDVMILVANSFTAFVAQLYIDDSLSAENLEDVEVFLDPDLLDDAT